MFFPLVLRGGRHSRPIQPSRFPAEPSASQSVPRPARNTLLVGGVPPSAGRGHSDSPWTGRPVTRSFSHPPIAERVHGRRGVTPGGAVRRARGAGAHRVVPRALPRGDVRADRVEDQGFGSSFGAASVTYFYASPRAISRRGSVQTHGAHGCVAFAFDNPSFPGISVAGHWVYRSALSKPRVRIPVTDSRGWKETRPSRPHQKLPHRREELRQSRGPTGRWWKPPSTGRARTQRTRSGRSSNPSCKPPKRFTVSSPSHSDRHPSRRGGTLGVGPDVRVGHQSHHPGLCSSAPFAVCAVETERSGLWGFRCLLRACVRGLFTRSTER